MSTITQILGTDNITASRAVINTNCTNLNTDKLETSLKGTVNGLAELGADGKVPSAQLPTGIGTGDVVGPTSSTDGEIALYSLTTGKILKNSSKTIVTILGADDTTLPTSKAVKDITDTKVTGNIAITGATKTKITYDSKGLVTSGADATGLDIVNTPTGNISATTVQGAINELDAEKVNYSDMTSSFTLYPTNVASDIATYYKMVTSITDPSYNAIAVDIATPAITGPGIFIASLASSANVLIGNPGIINVPTIGNIKRVSGSASASFYFEIHHRTLAGVETLVGTSNSTLEVTSATYIQFSTTALLNNGTWLSTDRIVIKYYATKSGTGSDPVYNFQFGGTLPVRTNFPVPISVLPSYLTAQNVGDLINTATSKTTPVDTDMVGLMDSRASNILKKLSWTNVKATLKTYFDTLYANIAGSITQSFGASTIELGHATDTTISRVRAGIIAVEGQEMGYLNIPQNSQSAAYTTVLADAGKHIYHPSADTTARTWTIDSNANVAYPTGTAITFVNDTSAGVLTIAITSDTLVLAGAGTTGSRTLRANGIATAIKVTSTRWIISGTNLT